jgi:hypothetical protein
LLFLWRWNSSVILNEEHRLRVYENRVLRRIFGPKREKAARGGGGLVVVEEKNTRVYPKVSGLNR